MLTDEQKAERAADAGKVSKVKKVTFHGGFSEAIASSVDIVLDDGWCYVWPMEKCMIAPKVGDEVKLYLRGTTVRGMDLNGIPMFYETAAELEAERLAQIDKTRRRNDERFEEERDSLDAAFEALPEVFQRRIAWFRDHNPRFRQEYEPYEMGACTDAVKLAGWAAGQPDPVEAVKRFADADTAAQRDMAPDLAYGDHSGNSFGFVVRLAFLFVSEPEQVYEEHGALTPLVGCDDYGCAHPRMHAGVVEVG